MVHDAEPPLDQLQTLGLVGAGGVWTTAGGRLRLGWRLLVFLALVVPLYLGLAAPLPSSMAAGSAALLVAALFAGWLLLAMEGRPLRVLGFWLRTPAVRECGWGFLTGCALMLAIGAGMAAVGALYWTRTPGTPGAYAAAGLSALGALALPAAAEEALLRGYPLQALSDAWGPAVGLLLTSTAFGLLHAANPSVSAIAVLNTGLAGAFLGALYLRTGSLWWPTGAHLGWNWSSGFLLDVPVSGLELADAPWLESHSRGAAALSGGGFGPEGSLISSLLLTAMTVWCWNTSRLRPASYVHGAPLLARLQNNTTGES